MKTPNPKEKNFKDRVLAIVAKIPKGQVMTYKAVAIAAQGPQAFRAVGTIMAKNFKPQIPCHRVIKSNGQVGNYNRGGEQKKQAILKQEKAI